MSEKGISKKEIIRKEALELFKEKEYDDVTIMDICNKCGITKRTFYYHFESKSELFSTLIDMWGVQADEILETITTEQKSIDILWQVMRVYCDGAIEYGPDIVRQIYILNLQGENNTHFPQGTHLYNFAISLLKKAQDNEEILNPNNAEEIVYILFHALRSICISWAAEGGTYNLIDEYLKTFYIIVGYPFALRKTI
ncbi:MAG: TetR/AcrR family transcriptional regulator [Erysipelotrichaceae bacterium]|nr:TetR/AcrR family transcriptional regulator [Erysipelotrichaceae bacterium]